MSDEFCAGVQILLKRMESNPDEFKDRGKWEMLTRAVFAHKEGNFADAWTVRSLTHAEIDALHAGCVKIYRPAFDEYVMKNVLDESETEMQDTISAAQAWQMSRGKRASQWNDPRMLAQVNASSGVTKVGGLLDAEPSPAFLQKIKKGLGL